MPRPQAAASPFHLLRPQGPLSFRPLPNMWTGPSNTVEFSRPSILDRSVNGELNVYNMA